MSSEITPRAKRTHARRSCELCKVRKTRCELPDIGVASSSTPLAADKACHRCQVLALPCVVDDTAKNVRRQQSQQDSRETSVAKDSPKSPKRKRSKVQKDAKTIKVEQEGTDQRAPKGSNGVNGNQSRSGSAASVDVLHGFRLEESTSKSAGGGVVMPPYGSSAPMESPQSKSMKLHGRPLELVCAMIGVAYGKRVVGERITMDSGDLQLDKMVDQEMKEKLRDGVSQLQTFHPWLDSLDVILRDFIRHPNESTKLLLATVLYLSSLVMPYDSDLAGLRASLPTLITHLRDRTLLRLPQCRHAVQALKLLALHAPFGTLPLQLLEARTLDIARGQIAAATNISSSLGWSASFGDLPSNDLDSTELWTWLALCADEAALALENETPLRPSSLDMAASSSRRFLQPEYVESWRNRSVDISIEQVIGRISVCDRITRLAAVHDALAEIIAGLHKSAVDRSFDLIAATVRSIEQTLRNLESIDQTHDTLMSSIVHLTQGVEAGWLAYRNLRKRFEANKVVCVGLRVFLATAYIPGGPLAFSGLPTNLPASQKVAYALARAYNPPDILAVLVTLSSPATRATWAWGVPRGDTCRAILEDFLHLSTLILPSDDPPNREIPSKRKLSINGSNDANAKRRSVIVPLHDSACIVVESTKVLLEMQRGAILMIQKSNDSLSSPYAVPTWYASLRQVCEAMSQIGALSRTHVDDMNGEGRGGMECVADGCATLLNSMRRMAHEYVKGVPDGSAPVKGHEPEEVEQPVAAPSLPRTPVITDSLRSTPQSMTPTQLAHPQYSPRRHAQPSLYPQPPPHVAPEQLPVCRPAIDHHNGHHQYVGVEQSDRLRLMASDHKQNLPQPTHNDHSHHPQSHHLSNHYSEHMDYQTSNGHSQSYQPYPQYSENGHLDQSSQSQYVQNQPSWPSTPTSLDLLLSQMFNYPVPNQQNIQPVDQSLKPFDYVVSDSTPGWVASSMH